MMAPYARFGKRATDVLVAAVSLVLILPLLMAVSVAIWCEDRRSVVFRQVRIGRHELPFTLLKFRSMRPNVGDVPSTHAGGLPVTRVGRVLRRTNLDELPQLVNILLGDMSLIGPRPALPSQHELLRLRRQSSAATIRPGLSGLAQVSSYDGMPVEEKARLDAEYADRISFVSDVLIVGRTIRYLLKPPPVY